MADATQARWTATLLELIRRASCELPADIVAALQQARRTDAEHPRACRVLEALQDNQTLARDRQTPLCQDTGTLTFFWRTPRGSDQVTLAAAAAAATTEATRRGWLRRNTIDALSGRSYDDNVADGSPVCHFEQSDTADANDVDLLLKGGGSENASTQYSLPDAALAAGRDLEGVRRCLLHAVWQAQGSGCAPGILGVCIGADRAEGYLHAKRQLLRPLADAAPEPDLAALETRVLAEANTLGIGPMGTGGRTTLLGVKIVARSRLPASFFVTVAYSCWACRRGGVRATPAGEPQAWRTALPEGRT